MEISLITEHLIDLPAYNVPRYSQLPL